MWTWTIFVILLASDGVSQVFEGSAADSGDTISARFVESSTDPSIMTSLSASEPTCLEEPFPGLGFRLNGVRRTSMFICANGLIRFVDGDFQNWPFNFGTVQTQEEDPVLAPFWARVDLTAFASGASKVRLRSYHRDINNRSVVFNRINDDVARFKGQAGFQTTWASVITWEDIKPNNAGNFGGRNTFQVVIASNETSWYVIYNYADIDWAVPAPRAEYSLWENVAGLPVIGWNTGRSGFEYINGQQYRNLNSSGTVNAEEIDDVSGNLGRGRWIFDLSGEEVKSAALLCYEWYISTSNVVVPQNLQCPPFLGVASIDWRFFRRDFLGRPCFVNLFPFTGPAIRCCYDDNSQALLDTPPFPGGSLSVNPLWFSSDDDDNAYQQCCVNSNFCNAYIIRRPKQDGSLYRPPFFAAGLGDPHYMNMDKMNYTFNGCGEFVFLDGDNSRLQLHVKFSRATGPGFGTVISAVVLKQQSADLIQVNHKLSGGMLLLVNGTEYAQYNTLSNSSVNIQNHYSVLKPSANRIIITTSDQHSISITREEQNLVLVVVLDRSLFGKTTGLLGNWSDTMDDDFVLPNGTVLQPPLTDEEIHFDFGEKWRIAADQSLFVNTSADAGFICPPDYQPMFISNFTFPNASIEAEAQNICGDNANCRFDIAATLSTSFGQTTLNSLNAVENDIATAENKAPTFSMNEVVFNLTLGETFRYTVSATDIDGNDIQLKATGLPAGATITQSQNNLTFEWAVNSTEQFELVFTATDTKNASTILIPTINVCACKNNGVCFKKAPSSQQTALAFSRFNVLDCRCPVSYTGQSCETLKNFCETASGSPCHPLVNCTNSQVGFICGPCPAGYEGSGQNCSDINECTKGTSNCEQLCTNTAGSFECRCNSGYQLNANKRNCDDINECLSVHNCMHTCINTEGSFNCSCNVNFIVDPNNPRNCIPKTACTSTHNCQQVCFVDESTGAQQCSCNRGYRTQVNDNTKCTDIDECQDSTDLCSQLCSNNQGSYTCSCIQGYRLQSDTFTCEVEKFAHSGQININECIEVPTSCKTDEGEKCFNLPGSFKCDCNDNQGLVRINGTCQVPPTGQEIPAEAASPPPNATQAQTDNAVQLRISNFQSNQWNKPTDTAFRSSIAAALTRYCNANESRRRECALPGNGFVFSELHINRLPNNPVNDGNDALISFYAVYPDGTRNESNVPVPKSALLNAINEQIGQIRQDTGLQTTVVTQTETPSTDDEGADFRLALGISVGVALVLLMGIGVACMMYSRKQKYKWIYDRGAAERRRTGIRRLSLSDPDFSITGETYPALDEDGLPVEVRSTRDPSLASPRTILNN